MDAVILIIGGAIVIGLIGLALFVLWLIICGVYGIYCIIRGDKPTSQSLTDGQGSSVLGSDGKIKPHMRDLYTKLGGTRPDERKR